MFVCNKDIEYELHVEAIHNIYIVTVCVYTNLIYPTANTSHLRTFTFVYSKNIGYE